MASIEKRIDSKGKASYRVAIRKNKNEIWKTFSTEEDAKLYAFYKERLIDNMKHFDVAIENRVTLENVFELKMNTIEECDRRTQNHFKNTKERLCSYFEKNKFICDISYDEWIECAKFLINTDVFRGAKSEAGKRKMSVKTLRNIFAYASSSISHAQKKGMKIENHPLTVINQYISAISESN